MAAGKHTQFLVQVPYTLEFGPVTSHRVGLELRLMFCGAYRDIKVLKY
jgi:hypothetical protein